MIIQKGGIKRAVDLPVQLCVTAAEAKQLVYALQEFIDGNAVGGWVDIRLSEDFRLGVNVKPLDWVEKA
jgi:hypothetical protein